MSHLYLVQTNYDLDYLYLPGDQYYNVNTLHYQPEEHILFGVLLKITPELLRSFQTQPCLIITDKVMLLLS